MGLCDDDAVHDWWIAAILGVVEGLTEFLPVSSTGHLILAGELLRFTGERAGVFEIFIQLGAILAVAWLYRRRLLELVVDGFRGKALVPRMGVARLTWAHLVAACLPAFGIGYLAHGFITTNLFSSGTVLVGLVLGGIFMVIAEVVRAPRRRHPVTTRLDDVTVRQAGIAGLAQCLALWPGFSRSGSTIAGGMLAGLNRRTAAELSFIVAVPVMLVATAYDLYKAWHLLDGGFAVTLAIGLTVSFVVAWLAVVGFLALVQRTSLTPFAIYRFALAGLYALVVLR